jgi:hypothetical protein
MTWLWQSTIAPRVSRLRVDAGDARAKRERRPAVVAKLRANARLATAKISPCAPDGVGGQNSNPTLDWVNSEALEGDVVTALGALKQGDGPDLLIQGSSDLIQTLLKSNLIFPVVLGGGKRLFGDGAIPAGLKLVETRSFPTGVILAKYEPAGDVQTGSFQLAEPSKAEIDRRKKLR